MASAGHDGDSNMVFVKCAKCHQVGPEAGNVVGPHLNGIFGTKSRIRGKLRHVLIGNEETWRSGVQLGLKKPWMNGSLILRSCFQSPQWPLPSLVSRMPRNGRK